MTAGFVAALMAGALAGGFINGLAGFGTALLALGVWLQIMPPPQAVAIAVVMSVASGLQGVWIVRNNIRDNPRRLARFLLPAIIGVPLGVTLLSVIGTFTLKMTIAAFMIVYGGFFTLRRSLPRFDRPTPVADSTIGFLGGILGGAASLSGALPTMWCAMRPWTKGDTRAVLQPYNVSVLALTMLFLAWQGQYTRETLLLIGLSLPATMIGAQLGITLFHRLDDLAFRRLLIGLMFASGLLLALRELF
ncbi:sulfite exporter TauE/SafE family protein [Paracoccus onubensis]|uniref:sulfite exporter TauE/SafE family protein n=1 Tax=Paracoccus onubensis TaxID=1675788 RepID=UPI00272F46E0|nr:sulfite exporter TauE/SafE family protein [Paracoccus onubensis]MDP0926757.1 sulfite exporter TauE/SafE family protein [Paracoccus onubensis]